MAFREITPQPDRFWQTERIHIKNLKAAQLFIDFSKIFDSIHRGKMEQMPQAYVLLQRNSNSYDALQKSTKAMVHSL